MTGFDETVPPDDDPTRDENAVDDQPPPPRTAAQLEHDGDDPTTRAESQDEG